jgi:phosphate transport system substrate-binding protein
MKMKNRYFIWFPVSFSIALFSCGGGATPDGHQTITTDEATYGSCSVSVDESYSIIMDAERDAFEATYPDAHVKVVYKPEGELVKDLMRAGDSTRFIMMSRDLNDEERKFFESKNSHPSVLKIAYDAVAIISNKDNMNDSLSLNQLRQILAEKLVTWKQVNAKEKDDTINIVFDNRQSGNARFIQEHFLQDAKGKLPPHCYAVNSNSDVINYVCEHKNALGVIGVNWISDKDDSLSKEIMKKIKVVAISSDSLPNEYYKPYQAYIAQKKYPLWREVYIINREGRMGLGTGFAHYIAGDKGQRIILKSGLVPATMPVRIVNINNE